MLTPEQVRALGSVLGETREHEIDCDGFLMFAAELVELRQRGRSVPAHLALALEHERLCANCREECAAIAQAVADLE